MSITVLYLIVVAIGVALALIAYFRNKDAGKIVVGFSLMEIVIMAVIGVINGVLGTPNAMLGRLFMTFSGSYGFLAFAAICGGFYVSGPLCGYIIRKPGAATIAETMNGVAQVLSGNPNGVMVLAAGFLQGFMSDLAYAYFGYKRWTLGVVALSGALAPMLAAVAGSLFLRRRRHGHWPTISSPSSSAWPAARSTPSFSSSRSPTVSPGRACFAAQPSATEEAALRMGGKVPA